MNAEQWRDRGFKTIFRHGCVFLIKKTVDVVVVHHTHVRSGLWMEREDLKSDPWLTTTIDMLSPTLARDIEATIADCYCDAGVSLCDFCGNIRPAPGLVA